ncbi:flagellar hook-length control protein FliK [Neptunicella sp. SCSIO 80796]|uniref:flagellar hook-length control protein FliK n=1 Tax=Neptunicella plasticusilytica TaxID=3117012 RepID=UPI003A4D9154
MPEVPSFSLQQLTDALQQIIQSPRQTAVSQQAIDVLVKHLGAEQLLLLNANGQLQLDSTSLKGELANNQTYQLLTSKNNQLLSFFPTDKTAPIQLAIKQTLVQQLLQLPPLQLSQVATTTIKLDAIIANILPQNIELKFIAPDSQQPLKQQILQASTAAELKLAAASTGQNQPSQSQQSGLAKQPLLPRSDLLVNLPMADTQKYSTGQPVSVELKPQGKNWQAVVIAEHANPSRPVKLESSQVTALLTVVSASKGLMLPGNIIPKIAPLLPQEVQNTLNQWLSSTSKPSLNLVIDNKQQAILQIQPGQQAVATVNLTKQQSQQIANLLPAVTPDIANTGKLVTTESRLPISGNPPPELHGLLRQLQPLQDAPAKLLNQLEKILADPLITKSPELKPLVEKWLQQLDQSQPQGKEQDHQQLRALLSAPALSLTPVQLVSPPATQGFVAGLVAMLQLSLASRLARSQPAQVEKLSEAINNLLGDKTGNNTTSQVSSRALRDFSQLEQQQQLTRTLSRLLANHQGNKVASAEQQIQGQESLFYNFSTGQGQDRKDVELLIRREPESSKDKKGKKSAGQRWHLTMKLEIGTMGEVLTKAILQKNQLELDFYTSNQDTLHQLMNFLPLLKKRFKALQIEVNRSQCQLGKIPATLQQRPYQLFETRV